MQEPKKKTATLNLRIDPALKKAVALAAVADRRTVTSLVEKLLQDHVSENATEKRRLS